MRITRKIIEADAYPDNEFKTKLLEVLDKMTITQGELDNWFTYHPPTDEQKTKYVNIRRAAKFFTEVVLDNTPPSADQTAAIRKIREAVMTANASIACYHESVYPSNVKMMMGERVPSQSLMKDETR